MKKKLPVIIAGFIISYGVMFLVNYMILKNTVEWSEEEIADSLAIVSQSAEQLRSRAGRRLHCRVPADG